MKERIPEVCGLTEEEVRSREELPGKMAAVIDLTKGKRVHGQKKRGQI